MALSITSPPRSPALAEDDNFVVMTTTIPTATQRPGFLITGVTAVDDVLNLRWGPTLVQMTFVAAPDDSGTQLRAASAQTLEEYLPQLMEGLYSVPAVEAAFAITQQADGVRLVLRDTLTTDLAATSSASLTVTIFGGAAATFQNLSAALILYRVGQVDPVIRLKAAYDVAGRTQFNLGGILGLRLGLPTLGGAYAVQQPAGFGEYFFRYADQYGRPPSPEKLTKSATFVAVAGGSAGDSLLRWGSSGNLQLCHSYFNGADQFFAKPVSRTQPDFAWIYVHGTASITPWVTVYFKDGTTAERQVALATAATRGLYCFPSGPAQCGIDLVPGFATKEALRYTFEMRGAGPSITYDLLQDCHPWEVFVAYENGAGGIETVVMRGQTERDYSASGERFERARAQVQGANEGAVQRYQVEGRRSWRLRTGYYNADYIEHLRQLVNGRTWIIDTRNNRYIEVLPAGGSVSLTTDDDDLHAMEITFTAASPDRNAHYL